MPRTQQLRKHFKIHIKIFESGNCLVVVIIPFSEMQQNRKQETGRCYNGY